MEGGQMHPNEELARRELELLEAGRMDEVDALYEDDVVIHYPGRNPLSGDHPLGAFVDNFRRLLGEDGSLTRELHDALGTDEHSVQLLRVTARARGRSHSWNATVVSHVRDGRFSEVWIQIQDQHALDAFLNSLAAE
jgi:ketosteroid isomerase-like protein